MWNDGCGVEFFAPWLSSGYPKQGTHSSGQRHCQRPPKSHTNDRHDHWCATCACSQEVSSNVFTFANIFFLSLNDSGIIIQIKKRCHTKLSGSVTSNKTQSNHHLSTLLKMISEIIFILTLKKINIFKFYQSTTLIPAAEQDLQVYRHS